jgi:gamma-glutamyltranspeptidase/glutathione hydrolase
MKDRHSDDVAAVDAEGNIAAITHTINSVSWGKTAISIDGITVGDPATYQQQLIAETGPGKRLPSITQTGILAKDGKPMMGFSSMSSGLHYRTFQCLLNVTAFGMGIEEAINTADFLTPNWDQKNNRQTVRVAEGRFDPEVLNATGYAWEESRGGGEGRWVAVSRDPASGYVHAASPNRGNSGAFAF